MFEELPPEIKKLLNIQKSDFPLMCHKIQTYYQPAVYGKLFPPPLNPPPPPTNFVATCTVIWKYASEYQHTKEGKKEEPAPRELEKQMLVNDGNNLVILCRMMATACAQFSEFKRCWQGAPMDVAAYKKLVRHRMLHDSKPACGPLYVPR